jgi:hypothetical protein
MKEIYEDKLGRACSMQGINVSLCKVLAGNVKEGDH